MPNRIGKLQGALQPTGKQTTFEAQSAPGVSPFKQDTIRTSLEDQLETGQQGHLESLRLKEAQRKLQAKESALAAAQDEKQGLLHRLSMCSMVPVDVMIASVHLPHCSLCVFVYGNRHA